MFILIHAASQCLFYQQGLGLADVGWVGPIPHAGNSIAEDIAMADTKGLRSPGLNAITIRIL